MPYEIKIRKPALKFILKQPPKQQTRLFEAIYQLPDGTDIVPMKGDPGFFRLRVGSYRIVYSVDNGKLIVDVIDANNRGDIYK